MRAWTKTIDIQTIDMELVNMLTTDRENNTLMRRSKRSRIAGTEEINKPGWSHAVEKMLYEQAIAHRWTVTVLTAAPMQVETLLTGFKTKQSGRWTKYTKMLTAFIPIRLFQEVSMSCRTALVICREPTWCCRPFYWEPVVTTTLE
jgi:hypothetical protein